jgi:hypothetical protein
MGLHSAQNLALLIRSTTVPGTCVTVIVVVAVIVVVVPVVVVVVFEFACSLVGCLVGRLLDCLTAWLFSWSLASLLIVDCLTARVV